MLELNTLERVADALSLKAVMEPVASEVSKEMLSREEDAAALADEAAELAEEAAPLAIEVAVIVTGLETVLVRVVVPWARVRARRVVKVVIRVTVRILVVA